MGLIAEDGSYVPLTDILGDEDAFGGHGLQGRGDRGHGHRVATGHEDLGYPGDILGEALTARADGSPAHNLPDERDDRHLASRPGFLRRHT